MQWHTFAACSSTRKTIKLYLSGIEASITKNTVQTADQPKIEFLRPNRSIYEVAINAPINSPNKPIDSKSALNHSKPHKSSNSVIAVSHGSPL